MRRKTALVIGTGIEVEHAVALGRYFNVKYWTNFWSEFPRFRDYSFGLGMEGIEKVEGIGEYLDTVDLIATFDIGYGDLINYFRKHGKVCFGAGLGEKMETDRWWLKKELKKAGLDVMKSVKVKGIRELREYLKKNDDRIVKLNIFRGDFETIRIPSYSTAESFFDVVETEFGAWKDTYEFIVEEPVDGAVEIGIDGIFSPSNGFLLPCMWGIELNSAYIGMWDNELPKWFRKTGKVLDKLMRQLDYRGFLSTEQRINKTGGYLIDITARSPYPLGFIFNEAIMNFGDVIWNIAKDEKVTPLVKHKWWGCLPILSEELKTNDVCVIFPEKIRRNVKINSGYMVNGKYYATKNIHSSIVCSIVAGGDSIDDVIKNIKIVSEQVNGLRLEKNYYLLDKIKEEFDKLKQYIRK